MDEILRFEGVRLTYHSKNGENLAVDNLDLKVFQGEFLGLVGPSGSGKTTILSMFAGILKPSAGRIIADFELRTKVGYMLQRDQLFNWRTVLKNVLLGLELRGKVTASDKEYAIKLLQKYGLGDAINKYPSQLSGGMKQRAALIRTLVLKPEIVLLDEPFSALDFQTRLAVGEDVKRIIKNEGLTAILVTHDISEAISIADRVAVLSKKPARVKNIFDTTLNGGSIIEKRECSGFSELFTQIWKELDVHEDENLFDRTSKVSKKAT